MQQADWERRTKRKIFKESNNEKEKPNKINLSYYKQMGVRKLSVFKQFLKRQHYLCGKGQEDNSSKQKNSYMSYNNLTILKSNR